MLFINSEREAALIDSIAPQTDFTSPLVTQSDNPYEDAMALGSATRPELPQADIGGVAGSRIRNGFSTGIKSLFNRQQPFSGAVAKPPAITNPVQGNVGESGRASRLYAGVKDQFATYTATQDFSRQYVGIMPDAVPSVKGTV